MGALEWLKSNADQVATAILAVVVAVAVALGKMVGRTPEPPKLAELAGAVIDSTDAKAIVAAVNTNTAAVLENTAARMRGDAAILEQLHEINARLETITHKAIEAVVIARMGR